jgi:hypothetical protein
MADIRLVRQRGARVWIWVGVLVAASLVVLGFSVFFGDPTEAAKTRRVGARANFGADRAPVIPVVVTPFEAVGSLSERDVGRLVHLEGWAQTPVRRNAVWVRATDGRRILVRFEPPPPGKVPVVAGGRVSVNGYLQKIALAELKVTLDSLGTALPRPRPTVAEKFGELPDSGFLRVDSLFVKNFYVSVRPEALAPRPAEGGK